MKCLHELNGELAACLHHCVAISDSEHQADGLGPNRYANHPSN